jgi:cardiolipin synthase
MTNLTIVLTIILTFNTVLAFITVFWSKRDASVIWAWLLVLTLLPVFGFIIFWFFGRRISDKRIFDFTSQRKVEKIQLQNNRNEIEKVSKKLSQGERQLMKLFLENNDAVLTTNNDVDIFVDGEDLFNKMFEEIQKATSSIHVEFFTIFPDAVGKKLVDLLTQKAKEGVEVRVIYDQFGSKGRQISLYKKLVEAGGTVYPFLMRSFQLLTLRFNFRLHRKIVVIDGKVGFIGGFNVGDQYMGISKKFKGWRDTHLRITGDSVLSLQSRFLIDWNATSDANKKLKDSVKYFPASKNKTNDLIQIISSGPDSATSEIKQGYLKMFSSAEENIYIQTPYFIPDPVILETLKVALHAGVKVHLMIPNQPDHPFVYRATEYYSKELMEAGADLFIYNKGFLHAKVVVIDNKVASIGSANMDIRSFDLNFEANAIVYSKDVTSKLIEEFEHDIENSKRIKPIYFKKQNLYLKFLQKLSRLFSPIL